MRRLTDTEETALRVLRSYKSYCPGTDEWMNSEKKLFTDTLKSLTKKKMVSVEMTDDGPRYHAIG